MPISAFPRVALSHLPTPLERLERLSNHMAGPEIFIKRDDCTGLATGGNKARKLEYLMADALRQGADTVVTAGAVQSNHVRQTAAAATRLGLACHALLEQEVPCDEPSYTGSANVLLNRLFNCHVEYCAAGADLPARLRARARELRSQGRKPYVIPVGGSNAVGGLGYVRCAAELMAQCLDRDVRMTRVLHASGSGATQAGLVAGFRDLGANTEVIGISVSSDRVTQRRKVRRQANELFDLMGLDKAVPAAAIKVYSQYVGEAYGIPTEAMREAMLLVARLEGILLDPVYTGKAMAGMLDLIEKGELNAADTVVFLHTGGTAELFAYDWYFNAQ